MSFRDFFRHPPALPRKHHLLPPPNFPATYAAARARLMPALRSRAMIGAYRDRVVLPLSSDAALMLVLDGDDRMQAFGPAQLAQWGVSTGEALSAAMDNLRDASVLVPWVPCTQPAAT
jgi:hypothetical protein